MYDPTKLPVRGSRLDYAFQRVLPHMKNEDVAALAESFRTYIKERFGPLVEISKIVGSEKIYPFSPAKVREAVARAEEE